MWCWKKKIEWWRNGARPLPIKDGDYLLAEKAYEAYTKEFQRTHRFATSTFEPFERLPEAAKEVWRKTAEEVARWTIVLDSGRGDLD